MLDILLEHIKVHIVEIIKDQNLPEGVESSHVAQIMSIEIFSHLKSTAQKGNIDGVLQMFSGKVTQPAHPHIIPIKNHLSKEISIQCNIDKHISIDITEKILPKIMNLFNEKVNSGSLDIESIINQFKGNSVAMVVEKFNSTEDKNKSKNKITGFFRNIFRK